MKLSARARSLSPRAVVARSYARDRGLWEARAVAKIQRRWRARQNARFFRRREIARGLSSRGGRERETTT